MKYYAYVGHESGVYTSWEKVHTLMIQYPFSSVRKFYTEEKAWAYVNSHKSKGYHSINKIGFTFSEQAVLCEYFIENHDVFINFRFPEEFQVIITPPERCEYIKSTEGIHMLHYTDESVSENSAHSQVRIFSSLLDVLGPIVDVNLYVEDDTLYYIHKHYSGYDPDYLAFRDMLNARIGEVAYVYDRRRSKQVFTSGSIPMGWRRNQEGTSGRESRTFSFEEV